MLTPPPEDRPQASDHASAFGLRPPLDDHPDRSSTANDDDRGWAAWLVIILLAAITLRGLMLAFGGDAGEVIGLFSGGEPAVVTPADRAPQAGPLGVDPQAIQAIATGLAELDGAEPAPPPATATPRDGYYHVLNGAQQLGLPAGAIRVVQALLGLAMVVLAFVLGRRFAGQHEDDTGSADRVGLIAAAIVAVHPAVLRAGASLEPTLWSAAALMLALYLLTNQGKRRVQPDGSTRRDWTGMLSRAIGAGVAASIAVVLGGIDTGLVYLLLGGLGLGLAWWVWQRERDSDRRRAKDAAAEPNSNETNAPTTPLSGWRRTAGLTAAVTSCAVVWVGLAAVAPSLVSSRGETASALNEWQAGTATRLGWATHHPTATPEAHAGSALAMVRGVHETNPADGVYAIADGIAGAAIREAPTHTSWRLQRDAWRAALTPASAELVAGFGIEPTGYDPVPRWLNQELSSTDNTDAQQAHPVLTAVGLLWAGLNLVLMLSAGLGLALLTARRRWGEAVCLGLILTATVWALVLGSGQHGAVGLLGLTACAWATAGWVLPRRAVVRRPRKRTKGQDGPLGISGAGGLLSVAMAVNPGDEDDDGQTPRTWRNLWGWWSAGDRDSDHDRAIRLPLSGGQGLPLAPPAPTDEEGPTNAESAVSELPGVEVLEASIEEEPKLVAGGRPL